MGVLNVIFAVLSAGIAIILFFALRPKTYGPIKPLEEKWWGDGVRKPENQDVTRFHLQFHPQKYTGLLSKLASTRFFQSLEDVNWEYGTRPDFMQTVVDYWQNKFSWESQVNYMNKFKHFKTNIDGIQLHFVHMKPSNVKPETKVLPIILVHGWPGSFFEFHKAIPLLLEEKDGIAFEIVVPSLPGYGYSSAPRKAGMSPEYISIVMKKLMLRLGHKSFYAQGGDWGSDVARMMARLFPGNVKGLHVNMWVHLTNPRYPVLTHVLGAIAPSLVLPDKKERDRIFPVLGLLLNLLEDTGYAHLQATKPDTIGFALNDSPAGLASYVLEKFVMGFSGTTCHDKDVLACTGQKVTLDELLTNVMIYWDTNSMPSAVRLYKEAVQSKNADLNFYPITVPTGFADFPREALPPPKSWVEASCTNLVSYSVMENGGHFAAFEEPAAFSEDVRKFVLKVESLTS
ncbi:epoxide hydrolase 1-like [Rhopilema esculentum]|uniref:epoxide hydrolase 1-like n=1 Tax=Rhopilema esculentum TaxID=499914 RepID=UPI0031D84931|eukprot:gene1431-15856_t